METELYRIEINNLNLKIMLGGEPRYKKVILNPCNRVCQLKPTNWLGFEKVKTQLAYNFELIPMFPC